MGDLLKNFLAEGARATGAVSASRSEELFLSPKASSCSHKQLRHPAEPTTRYRFPIIANMHLLTAL